MKQLIGAARVFGDGISTDKHVSAKYRKQGTPMSELVERMFEDIRPGFAKQIGAGDVLVAGTYFGNASSREDAVAVMHAAGIRAIVAKSYARLFYRNAINLGMPVLIADTTGITEGENITIDLENRELRRESGETRPIEPVPQLIQTILADGGLVAHLALHHGFALEGEESHG
jgi:3-isopropylmalate/(R)-2-methylmalate dehydratase small subunit